jgi:uncharacterized integral membrane protein
MDLTRNVKGALSFVVIMMFLVVWDTLMEHGNPSWTTHYPAIVGHSMSALEGLIIPVIFLLSGAALFYSVLGERRGYVGLLLLGILAIVWNVPAAIWRFQAGAPFGATICLAGIVAGLIICGFAISAMQESPAATRLSPSSVAS